MTDNAAPLILLTRPRVQSERFAAQLQDLAETLILPLQEIVPTGPVPKLNGFEALIFTSENAVRIFAEACARRDLPTWCVGTRTAKTATDLGFLSQEGGGSAEALINAITQAAPSGPLLHLHGRHTRGSVAKHLSERGIRTEAAEIYEQRATDPEQPIAPLGRGCRVIAPLFSPRSAQLLADHVPDDAENWSFPCLSEAVRAALPDTLRQKADVAQETTANAMVCLLKRHISP